MLAADLPTAISCGKEIWEINVEGLWLHVEDE
jgi:hypothetical protein